MFSCWSHTISWCDYTGCYFYSRDWAGPRYSVSQ